MDEEGEIKIDKKSKTKDKEKDKEKKKPEGIKVDETKKDDNTSADDDEFNVSLAKMEEEIKPKNNKYFRSVK